MWFIKKTCLIFNVYFFLFLYLCSGCDMSSDSNVDVFNDRMSKLLGDNDSVKIVASDLTDFLWDRLCFNREDLVKLTFYNKGSEIIYKFDYEEYFIDEAYVDGSPDGLCISNNDYLLIKRKYPGYSKTIEFFMTEI